MLMPTVSVPLSAEQYERLDGLVANGSGTNRADVMRRAFDKYAEDEAVQAVLDAEKEVAEGKVIRGDLQKLILGD